MISARVVSVIATVKGVEPDSITLDKTFEELAIDSLDAVEIMFEIEEEFDLEISDEKAREVRSVGDIVRMLEERLEEAGGEA
jgi:acyl carrier protein